MYEEPQLEEGSARTELDRRHLAELHRLAAARGVPRFRLLRRGELIDAILAGGDYEPTALPLERRVGVLDLVPDGYGFMRVEGLGRSPRDVYVSRSRVRELDLRSGDELAGPVRPPGHDSRYASLAEVESVNGKALSEREQERPAFHDLTPVWPTERLSFTDGQGAFGLRMVELLAPLGKGHRCLIAAPPGAGATRLLREMTAALARGGDAALLVVLVDARPEEITEFERTVDVPVHVTTPDRSPEAHVRLAELALERAQRMVEDGGNVVLVIDSITRLGRAESILRPRARGRSRDDADREGERVDDAVRGVKRWFAAARNTGERGSLTIIATARVGSNEPLEELTYAALSENANLELRLNAELASTGRWPALDTSHTRTQAEESFVVPDELDSLRRLRASLRARPPAEAWQFLAERIAATASNSELLSAV